MKTGLTPQDIDAKIKAETYTVLPDGRTTICQLTLANGFTVNGTSSVIDPTKFNEQKGREIARADAVSNVWPLEGYLLAEQLHRSMLAAS